MELATRNQRFVNYIIDLLIIIIFIKLFVGPFGLFEIAKQFNLYFLSLLFLISYYSQEIFSGRTIGKFITATRAVNANGSDLDFKKVIVRSICRCIPFEQFTFLFGGNTPRGLHDEISGTQVIKVIKATSLNALPESKKEKSHPLLAKEKTKRSSLISFDNF